MIALWRVQRSLTDWVKIVAAIAVVGIHSTSGAEHRFALHHDYLSLDFLGVFVNQWARFSVPLFLYLSAYGLAVSELAQPEPHSYSRFVAKRLPTILVPYLFFSAIPLAMEFHSWGAQSDHSAFDALLWKSVATKLVTGTADYHLYFLVILAQCYLLFPLLLRISRRYGTGFRAVTWITFAGVVLLLYKGTSEWTLAKLGFTHPGWHASFCVYWLPYFMLGIAHASKSAPREVANPAVRRNDSPAMEIHSYCTIRFVTYIILCLIALTVVLIEYNSYSRLGTPVDYYNHFSRPSVALYTLAVIGLLHAVAATRAVSSSSPAMEFHSQEMQSSKQNYATVLGPLTFAVYLLHPQILRIVTRFLPSLPSVAVWLLVTVVTFALVYLATNLTRRLGERGAAAETFAKILQRALGLR